MSEPNYPAKLREIAEFMVPVFGADNPAVCYLRESAGEMERLRAMVARLAGCDLELKGLRAKFADRKDDRQDAPIDQQIEPRAEAG